jgi:3'-5' exoribonuclease
MGDSDAGVMLGHLVLGERRVRRAADAMGEAMPDDTALRLSHILLSHHGELEWGSPTRPVTIEALVLHHADNLDAKVGGFMRAVGPALQADERWTRSSNEFKRRLLVPEAQHDHTPPALAAIG